MQVPDDLTIEAHEPSGGVKFGFSLPAGAYATTLLREFQRADDDPLNTLTKAAKGAAADAEADGEADGDALFIGADSC